VVPRVRIIHWKPEEAGILLERVRAAGFEAEHDLVTDARQIARAIEANPPSALAIDLSRLPSHGREFAVWLRRRKVGRSLPFVFVGGEPEKVARIRELLPGDHYTSLEKLATALKRACHGASKPLAVPPSPEERYKHRTVAQKLGIRENSTVGVVDPPRDYAAAIGPLPEGAELIENPRSPAALTVWFVHHEEGLLRALPRMRAAAAKTKLWISWRKGVREFNGNAVRICGIEYGLVDYKICALGDRWSAMAFARKKE
jgi:hypothetical protein